MLAVLLKAEAIGCFDGVHFDKIGGVKEYQILYGLAMSFKIEEFALGFESRTTGHDRVDGRFTKQLM